MADITVNSRLLGMKGVNVHVDDHGGSGRPVVLIHGWPLSGKSWNDQIQPLLSAGFHVITYDRRGFGDSDKPSSGYDYDTLTDDLNGLMEALDLHDTSLVGFSMGGGEVARYVAKYGEERLHSIVFAAAIPPYLLKSDDNPEGPLDESLANSMASGLKANDKVFYQDFLKQFFSANGDRNVLVSEPQMSAALALTAQADKGAALQAMEAFGTTDFRDDLTKITIPTLILHGDSDGIVPFAGSGKRSHDAIPSSEVHLIAGGPHGINNSHVDEFNGTLIDFLEK